MLGLIGIIGILGCATVVFAVVAVVGTAVSVGVGVAGNMAAEDAAEKQQDLQEAAMEKAENRSKADAVIQKKLVARNLLKARQSIGTSIAYEKLLAARTTRKAAKVNSENGNSHSGSSKQSYTKYSNGSPTQSG